MVKIDEEKKEVKIINTYLELEDKDVLEIGCGDGRLSFILAKKAKKLVGVDIDKNSIKTAIKNTPEKLKKKVEFRVGNSKKLKFGSSSFDTVFMAMSLHEIPASNQIQSLKEIKRVLKEDGQLFIIEPKPHGEIQSLYSICLLKIFNNNHPQLIENARKLLEKRIKKGLFKLEFVKEFSTNWVFNDFQDLYAFFLREHKLLKSDSLSKKIMESMKNKLAKKISSKPLTLKDELIIFSLRNKW